MPITGTGRAAGAPRDGDGVETRVAGLDPQDLVLGDRPTGAVFCTFIWPELRMPVTRATMCSRPIWSKSKPIQRIIECEDGRFWPHGYVPPPS